MSEPIEILGYAKTDRNGKQYFFFRSSEESKVVDLKDFVLMVHPFQTSEGKDKARLILRPADKNKEAK